MRRIYYLFVEHVQVNKSNLFQDQTSRPSHAETES